MTVALTGTTGRVGGRVAERVPGARAVTARYRDRDGLRRELEGATTLFLVSGRESADRLAEHRSAVDAAVDAGVQRVVYLSFLGAAPDTVFTLGRDHWHTEQHIRAAGLAFTLLRDSFYLAMLPALVGADGVIRGPAGDGRVSAVAHDDVADVAAAVLTGAGHDGRTYDVTGPEAITLAQAAERIGRVTGRPVRYQPETVEEAYASRASYGAPDFEVAGWVTSYLAIAAGELSTVSDTVQRVAGHPPIGLDEYLRNRGA